MDSDDDMDFEDENEEILKNETLTLGKLRGKELIVQNRDGTLRCPLSPSRKKQAYAYKDLLQHATAVASGKRGAEAAGNHSALKKFLESDLSSLSTPPPERLFKVEKNLPPRLHGKEMLVWPWSVVICNIDNSRRDTAKPDFRVGLGKTELREYFKNFNPVQLEVCWGPRGHLGMCVLHFGRALSGLKDAQALENSFLDKEHGLRDYERHLGSANLGNDFYGWLAREDDYHGRRCGKEWHEVGKYLRKQGNLKDIAMVADEIQLMHDQQLRQLAATVSKKNQESEDLKTEMESIRRKAEAERQKLEESHKLELEGLRMKARISEDEYNQATVETNRALEKREAELRQLDMELREKESKLNSSAEKNELQAQIAENRQLRERIADQQALLQQKHADKIKLFYKHEEESQRLAERARKEALKLAIRQNTEMEREQLQTRIETEKLIDKVTIKQDILHENKKVEELQEKLKELESNQEDQDAFITELTVKDRQSTDEIEDARKYAVQVIRLIDKSEKLVEAALKKKDKLDPTKQPQPRVAVRMAGAIDETSWQSAFKRKYKSDDEWYLKMTKALSSWEELIKNPEFNPFKMVQIGEDKWKKEIDYEDPELVSLKKAYGEKVYNSVTTALMEIEEYNASGRYPIPVPWIPEKSRKASLKEVVAYLGEIITALITKPNAPRKKARC